MSTVAAGRKRVQVFDVAGARASLAGGYQAARIAGSAACDEVERLRLALRKIMHGAGESETVEYAERVLLGGEP